MTGRVARKVALVTGAASGIGRATALALMREGASVAATDLAPPDLPGALCLAHDVADEAAWERAIAAILDRFDTLDVLVNNAGIGGTGPLLGTTLAAWRQVIAINLDGVFLGTRAAIAAMQAHPDASAGSVVNVSSIMGLVGGMGLSAYSAAKGGVRLFTKAVALEGAALPRQVRVNSVHPGYIDTPLVAGRLARVSAEDGTPVESLMAGIAARHPLGRLGRAEEVANGVLFLASDEASFVTGTELVVDGGYTAQ